jgi:hypothetical protein
MHILNEKEHHHNNPTSAPLLVTASSTTIIIIIIKSIPGRVEELRILIVIGVNTPVKDLPALQ